MVPNGPPLPPKKGSQYILQHLPIRIYHISSDQAKILYHRYSRTTHHLNTNNLVKHFYE